MSTSSPEAGVPQGTGCNVAASRTIFVVHLTRQLLIDL
jgi:hypothetical protein